MSRRVTVVRVLVGIALLVLCSFLWMAHWLRTAPGEWTHRVQAGPIAMSVSMRKLVNLMSRPLIARLVANRNLHSAAGWWHFEVPAGGEVRVVCSPCVFRVRALGGTPVNLERAALTLKPAGPDRYSGVLNIRNGSGQLTMPWTARMGTRGVDVEVKGDNLALSDVVAVLGQDMTDIRDARITGSLTFDLRLSHPERALSVHFQLVEFGVSGLGTEQLLDIELPRKCQAPSGGAIGGWLPRAVIAAEDQLFYSHPGYDTAALMASLRSNARSGQLSGASTVTQQLARLVYTGAERSHQRKLRELLYAVEMERTLGKARILQLYLALAPWGNGICGAQHAAQRYLGKAAADLSPLEAAWLADLLVNPEARLAKQLRHRSIDVDRVVRILNDIRPMAAWRRQLAISESAKFLPPVLRPTPTGPVAAGPIAAQ